MYCVKPLCYVSFNYLDHLVVDTGLVIQVCTLYAIFVLKKSAEKFKSAYYLLFLLIMTNYVYYALFVWNHNVQNDTYAKKKIYIEYAGLLPSGISMKCLIMYKNYNCTTKHTSISI